MDWWQTLRLVALVSVLGACATAPRDGAFASLAPTPREALPPIGFLQLCARAPEECFDSRGVGDSRSVAATAARLAADLGNTRSVTPAAIRGSAWTPDSWSNFFAGANATKALKATVQAPGSSVPLSDGLLTTLKSVNDAVNRKIIPRSDAQIFGKADYWDVPSVRVGPPYGDCEDYVLEKRHLLVERGIPSSSLSIAIVKIRSTVHAVLLVSTSQGPLVLDSLSPWILPWRDVRYEWLERQERGEAFVWTFGPPDEA